MKKRQDRQEDIFMGRAVRTATTIRVADVQMTDMAIGMSAQEADTRGMCTGRVVGILSMGKLPTGSRGIYMMRDARTAKLEAESPSTY